ncbi:MAG: hypothetical protein ABEK04_04160 [Candidatus Nanohalobium sp.]
MSSPNGKDLEKFVLKVLKKESGSSGVLETSIVRFVVEEASKVFEKKHPEYDVSRQEWRKVADDLDQKGFSVSFTEYYGKDRKKIDFSACSYDKKLLKQYFNKKLGKAEQEIEECYREVNKALETLDECRSSVKASNLPTYGSRSFGNLKQLYGNNMADLLSNILNLPVNFPEDRVKLTSSSATGYDGKTNGRFKVMLMNDPNKSSDLYEVPENDIKAFVKNAPVGASGQRDVTVPHRACDVLAVDLLHELGHVASDLVAEAKLRSEGKEVPEGYRHSGLYKQVFGNVSGEKAANEVAAATVKALAGNLGGGVFQDVEKGFEAYLELTKWDNPASGYQRQHPIKGSRGELNKVFS